MLVGLTDSEGREEQCPPLLRSAAESARAATHTPRGPRWSARLSSYNSPSDLDDLHAILDRYNDRETVQIRRILAAQRIR